MADGVPKGTVKPLASLISVEEAQNAAKRVHEAIEEREKEASYIERFITENNNLFKLVHTLPDQLSHPIMVIISQTPLSLISHLFHLYLDDWFLISLIRRLAGPLRKSRLLPWPSDSHQ